MVEHVNIPDNERHEPKGITSATDGQVYVADGSNSGAWTTLNLNNLTVAVPASASATGTVGDIAFDSSHIYICIATDTWERVAIASWP